MKKINKDTTITIASNIIPGLIALAAFPLLLRILGDELFGFFMIAWASIGISSLLDLGIGRAISHYCAKPNVETRSNLANTAFTILIITSLAIVGIAFAIWYTYPYITRELKLELYLSVKYLIACLPLAIITTGLRGSIEGREKFGIAAVLRTATSLIFVIIPSLIAVIYKDFESIALSFLFARVLVFIIYISIENITCNNFKIRKILNPKKIYIKEVYSYAGWLSISTLAGSTLGYMDRITLTLLSPLNEIAHYTAPFEAISRALIIPGSISTTLFPKLSGNNNLKKIDSHINASYRDCVILTAPLLIFIFMFSKEILEIWLGKKFSNDSSQILQILSIGVFFNALAHIPLASLQALGRPKIAAYLHIAEIIPVAILFTVLVKYFGATGAALSWTIRSIIDLSLLNYLLNKEVMFQHTNS